MTTSIATFRNEFQEKVLNFVWHQWCRMGVAGSLEQKDSWVIDPEPLLAFTSEVARLDARMFDEMLDWLAKNGHWINTQRLSTVVHQDDVGDKAVVGAMAAWMSDQDKSMKWRGLAQRTLSEAHQPEEPLFGVQEGERLLDRVDDHFRRYGLVRAKIQTRGMTQSINLKDPVNLMIRSRAVFGLGLRADVMAYLLIAEEEVHPRDLARILGYNHMRVQEILAGLADTGIASVRPVGRTKQYRIDRSQWQPVLMGEQTASCRWVNWRALTRGLTMIWRQMDSLDENRADDYVFSSKMRALMQSARNDLLSSGMEFKIEDDKGYLAEAYLPVFMRDANAILKVLSD